MVDCGLGDGIDYRYLKTPIDRIRLGYRLVCDALRSYGFVTGGCVIFEAVPQYIASLSFVLVLFHENCTNRSYRVFGVVFEAGAVVSGCGSCGDRSGSGFGLAF